MKNFSIVSDNYEAWQEGHRLTVHGFAAVTDKAVGLQRSSGSLLWLAKSLVCATVERGVPCIYIPTWLGKKNRKALAECVA